MDPSRHPRYAPPPPILPIEIVEEIICNFPVKFLLQLRCVCKSWNSLISDPKFARRHLRRSNRCNLFVWSRKKDCISYPLSSSAFKHDVITGATQLDNPLKHGNGDYSIIGSCDGVICCYYSTLKLGHSFVLWNPSIRKTWQLTPLEKLLPHKRQFHSYGFGYDNFSDSFKLVVIFYYRNNHYKIVDQAGGYQTMVHTVGSNCWRRIENFPCIPYRTPEGYRRSGKFVSGALNWLARDKPLIISIDLRMETYQEISQPDYGVKVQILTMDTMRGCLCILARVAHSESHLWVMKEYGNNESWTKLLIFPSQVTTSYWNYNFLCVLEDGESLFYGNSWPTIYIYKNGTFRSLNLRTQREWDLVEIPNIFVHSESLVSPFP